MTRFEPPICGRWIHAAAGTCAFSWHQNGCGSCLESSHSQPKTPFALWRAISPCWVDYENLALDNRAVVRFYNKRGTAEQWIEGKQA